MVQEHCCSLCHPVVGAVEAEDSVTYRNGIMNIPKFKADIEAVIDAWKTDDAYNMFEILTDYSDLPSQIVAEIKLIKDEKYLLHQLDVWDESLGQLIYTVIEEHSPRFQ